MTATGLGGTLLGGIGLFLLGMWMMTEGLRLAAGAALRDLLARSTRTRWRALLSGFALTAIVQSSSAVTVAAIGFVNAGLLSLGQVLWVLFGANVGTTVTGWLVAIVGLKFKIELLALPLIGLGMLARLSGSGRRLANIGTALAGFGVLFLGIDILRGGFVGFADGLHLPAGEGIPGLLMHLLVGAVLTLLMQSSSAATALVLTAAQGAMIGIDAAAAVVIGANIGTTGTAMLAALGATASAKRAAAAHVLFNLLGAAVALLMLPWMLAVIAWVVGAEAGAAGIATSLALFHTGFNVLGVLLMWPLAARLARFLEGRFRTAEDDFARPRYLDASTAAVPALAIEALSREVARLGAFALSTAREHALRDTHPASELRHAIDALDALEVAIDGFVVQLNRASMTQESAQRLAGVLRRLRYYANVTELLATIASASRAAAARPEATLRAQTALRHDAADVLRSLDPLAAPDADPRARVDRWDAQYQVHKTRLLEAGALGQLVPADMEALLRSNSALRRAVQQSLKALLLARGPDSSGEASADVDSETAEPLADQGSESNLPSVP